MHLSLQAFKAREMSRYRTLITITAILGVSFVIFQWTGFHQLEQNNVALTGPKSNSAASFFYVITGIHVAHVVGGVIALLIIFFRAFSSKWKNYSPLPIQLLATYWHFVGVIWIYLFIFYQWIG
jgi:cytochrome c oxidase subunit 3